MRDNYNYSVIHLKTKMIIYLTIIYEIMCRGRGSNSRFLTSPYMMCVSLVNGEKIYEIRVQNHQL